MVVMPVHILGIWFRGLLAVAILAGGASLLYQWYDGSQVPSRPAPPVVILPPGEPGAAPIALKPTQTAPERHFAFHPGWNLLTAFLVGGGCLLGWGLLGGLVGQGLARVVQARPVPGVGGVVDAPRPERTGTPHTIDRPDGSKIHVETYGPPDAPPIVFVHGWAGNSTAFFYPKMDLTDRFRLILWDEPGLGLSKQPDNNDFSMEKFARDLQAVLTFANRPAILVGHSIGGMILLTYCRLFREVLRSQVAGLALVHTTYKDPTQTMKGAAVYAPLKKPVLIPMMHVTIALYPLFWGLTWLSYLNGSLRRSTAKASFAGTETEAQLKFCTAWFLHARPDVVARGMLGMMAFDETATLPGIEIPTLVVVGDQDETCLPSAGKFMAETIPGAELATLAPARHLGLIEQHRAFDPLLARFSESCFAAKDAAWPRS